MSKISNNWFYLGKVDSTIYQSRNEWPKISIVTPSYNQGQYIEETILSVLNQNYPHLEYIIMDGGSTDETVEVIKKYEHKLAYWTSEPDNGQADAINKGFKKATGDILAWINSDDYYLKGAFEKVAKSIDPNQCMIFYGDAAYYYQNKNAFSTINVVEKRKQKRLPFDLGFVQPATFWTAKLWQCIGELDISYNYGFDWDWYLRASEIASFTCCDEELAIYRIHDEHKTSNGGEKRAKELLNILSNRGYSQYSEIIGSLDADFVRKVTNLTARYRVGKIYYTAYRLWNPNLYKFPPKEVGEIFNKARGIYG